MLDGVRFAELAAYVGAEAAGALRDWQRANGYSIRIPARPWQASDGYSGATLHSLIVGDTSESHHLILKAVGQRTDGEDVATGAVAVEEPMRHRLASRANPAFAKAHMVDQPFPALLASGNRVLMFQAFAADGATCMSMAALPADELGDACAVIVRELIHFWNDNTIGSRPSTLGRLLAESGGTALASSGTMRRWAEPAKLLDIDEQWIRLPADEGVYPNPVLMALGTLANCHRPVDVMCGLTHGDLHLLNVLLPLDLTGRPILGAFQLIDLATFRETGPLTQDPAYLMLSAVAATLDSLPPSRWDDLIGLIVGSRTVTESAGPFGIVRAIYAALRDAVAGARAGGWAEIWQRQLNLSVQALALAFCSFELLSPATRWWFFRLSAYAARQLVDEPATGPAPCISNPFSTPPVARPAVARALGRPGRSPIAAHAADAGPPPSTTRALLLLRHDKIAAFAEDDTTTAVASMVELRDMAVRDLGAVDPLTLTFQHNLAVWTERSGRAAEALQLFHATLREAREALGPAHPLTRACEEACWSHDLHRRAGDDQAGKDRPPGQLPEPAAPYGS